MAGQSVTCEDRNGSKCEDNERNQFIRKMLRESYVMLSCKMIKMSCFPNPKKSEKRDKGDKSPQKSRQTMRAQAGKRGANLSKEPALSIQPCRARTGTPSSGPQTLAEQSKEDFNILNRCKYSLHCNQNRTEPLNCESSVTSIRTFQEVLGNG